MGQVSPNSNVGCIDVGVSTSLSNKTICSLLVHFLVLLAIETLNSDISANTNVRFFYVGMSFSPTSKTICSFLCTFPLIVGY